jgi:hypothetical protein
MNPLSHVLLHFLFMIEALHYFFYFCQPIEVLMLLRVNRLHLFSQSHIFFIDDSYFLPQFLCLFLILLYLL